MTYHLRIADLPSSERPRERLLAVGVKMLSTTELVALLLGTGQGACKLSAVGLAQYILQQLEEHKRDPLSVLREIEAKELMRVPGVGLAKAAAIVAAVELGKRVFQTRPNDRPEIDSPEMAAAMLSGELMWQDREKFAVLSLDVKNRAIATRVITVGTATETLASPRDIFREVIRHGAIQAIVAHNHPTGSIEPSREDIDLTRRLLEGARCLDIPILDHLILGNGTFCSLHQTTTLWDNYG